MARKRKSRSRRRSNLGSLGVPLCPCSPQQMAGLGAGNEDDPYPRADDRFADRRYRSGITSPSGAEHTFYQSPGMGPRENKLKSDVIFFVVLAAAAGGGYFLYKHFKRPAMSTRSIVGVPTYLAPPTPVTAGPPEAQPWQPGGSNSWGGAGGGMING